MAHGRPDFTYLADTDIIAQTIGSIATDIAAQSVGDLAVDIVAQTLAALKVDITAQTLAQLNVDIIAQTLSEMAVNITAQDLAELIINIAAQTVGVYLQPEWAAKEGVDKNFLVSGGDYTHGNGPAANYTVTAGKTLYICGASFNIRASAEADGDKNQLGSLYIKNNTTSVILVYSGGNGGGSPIFPKPLVVPSANQLVYGSDNWSAHTVNIAMNFWGYEV